MGFVNLAYGMYGLIAVAGCHPKHTRIAYHAFKVILLLRLALDGYVLSNYVLLMRSSADLPEDVTAMKITLGLVCIYFLLEYGLTWHLLSSLKSLARVFEVGGSGRERLSAVQIEATRVTGVTPKRSDGLFSIDA